LFELRDALAAQGIAISQVGASPVSTVSHLKTHLRMAAERTVPGLWDMIGNLVDLVEPQECRNDFKAAGYEAN
jgi:hypothetical protein